MTKKERESLMRYWGAKVYDFLDPRNSWIRGDIGEEIARHYFLDCGLIAFLTRFDDIEQIYPIFRINEDQEKYLKRLSSTSQDQHWWDLVAVQGHPKGKGKAKIWLVEVKTGQVRLKSIQSLQKEGKLANEEQISYEKSLGFRHLLVYIQLIGDWKVEVSCQEI